MDKNQIEPKKQTVNMLFVGNEWTINIPKYQRPFSWNVDNAEKFYLDIFKNKEDDYFMSSILLNQFGDNVEVVDGQQRITTISLFFIALYLYLKSEGLGDDTSDVSNFIKKGAFNKKKKILNLSKSNANFYNDIVNLSSISDLDLIDVKNESLSNKNILAILKFFVKKITEEKISDKNLELDRVETIYNHICHRLFFIVITAQNSQQASKLFEVLNNRGVDLTESDLIRNYLLSTADEQGFDDGLNIWENLEKNIGIDSLEQFLRYSSFLISEKDSIYDRVFEYTKNKASSKTTLNYLDSISKYYLQVLSPESYVENEKISSLLNNINVLGVTQSRSLILASLSIFDMDSNIRLLDTLFSITFRYSTICGLNPNRLEATYSKLSFDIYNNKKDIGYVLGELSKLNPSDKQFELAFLEKDFKGSKIPRFILKKLEEYISGSEKKVDLNYVHLEHVMPKKIDNWLDHCPNLTKDLYEKYVNNIGNMVLLSENINTSIKNSLFDVKKEKYKNSKIELIKDIIEKNTWGQQEIILNNERYLNIVKKIWK